jgi:tetratricopeptide (TPR) repeat protein
MRAERVLRRVWLALGLGLGWAALSGCGGLTAQQQQWLAEAREAYDARNYGRAAERTSLVLKQVESGPAAAKALYLRGASYASTNRRTEAVADLKRAAQLEADPESTWRAYVTLGTLAYEDGRWEDARQALSAAVARMPKATPMDIVLFRLGVACERTGRWGDSRQPFQQIVRDFPGSSVAEDARRRIQLNADHFAVQCGVFAQSSNADRQAADLRTRGFDAHVRREQRGAGMVHVVLVGRYTTYEQMLQQLVNVQQVSAKAVAWPG